MQTAYKVILVVFIALSLLVNLVLASIIGSVILASLIYGAEAFD
jgi:hypothetical protein